MAPCFKINGPPFRISQLAPRRVGATRWLNDDNVDITTGVTTRFPGGVDGHQAGYDGIRSVTQVGPRTVEAGLGGHDAGVSGVDEGVESALLPL